MSALAFKSYLLFIVVTSLSCVQNYSKVYVFFDDEKIEDFELVINDDDLKYSELQESGLDFVNVTLIFSQTNHRVVFSDVYVDDVLECNELIFRISDTAIGCSRLIQSKDGVLRFTGNRDDYISGCEAYNDLIFQFEED